MTSNTSDSIMQEEGSLQPQWCAAQNGGSEAPCDNEYSTDKQDVVLHDDNDTGRPIIVTGFGGILQGESNLSTKVMQEFYQLTTNGKISYGNSEQIPILTGCPDMMKDHDKLQPIETSYKFVTNPPFDHWLKSTDARLTVHLGTKEDILGNEIWFELQACNGGARFWVADDYGTTCYGEECIPGGCQYLQTSFDILVLIEKLKERVSNATSISGIDFSFMESNDAGHFLCDFLYYRSLFYATQRSSGSDVRNVIFVHIPVAYNLSSDITASVLALLLEQIVYCLLDMCSSSNESQRGLRENTPLSRSIENGGSEKLTNGIENQPNDEESCHTTCEDAHTLPQNGFQREELSSHYDQSPRIANLRDKQEVIPRPIKQSTVIENAVIVTGFDPIWGNIPNQSWIIVQKFCSLFQQKDGMIEHNSIPFQLMTGPPDCPNQPIKTTYKDVTSHDFDNWLKKLSNALLYIHVGVDDDSKKQPSGNINTFSFDKVAANGDAGYWREDKNFCTFPGPCIECGDDCLRTQFSDKQLSNLVCSLPDEVSNQKINGMFTFEQSTKAGNFLCDFLYYRSLYYATQRNKASVDGRKSYVIFIHIPSKLKPNNLAGATPMALVLNIIVHTLLDIIALDQK